MPVNKKYTTRYTYIFFFRYTLVIEKINPKEQIGVKVPFALNICIEQPKQFVFGQEFYFELADKAAVFFELLISKHSFYNENKQFAAVSLDIFLRKSTNIELQR